VLGSVLLAPMESIGKAVLAGVKGVSFYDRRNQVLWDGLVEMSGSGVGMDAITIMEFLKNTERLDKAGGFDRLVELQDAAVVPAHVEHYSNIVLEKATLRSIIALGSNVIDEAYLGEADGGAILQRLSGRLVALLENRTQESNQVALDRWYQRMVDIKNGLRTNGLPLPWPVLNKMMSGLEPGLILVGARPSCGKTTLEVNICDFLARNGVEVARACLDMSREALLVRSVIRESRVSLPRMKYGFARWSQLETVRECKDLVASWPHHVIEDNTLDGICSTARMLKLKHNIELLTVDFAQLITSGNGALDGNMNALMGQVTKKLKALAFELDIPVLLLSQLNRGSDKDDRRPVLSDLRDSGNLEQNATQVILMSKAKQEDYSGYDKESNPEPLPEDVDRRILRGIVFDLAKNQNGETGMVEMWMRPNYFRFEQAESEFMDIDFKRAEWVRETNTDEACDPAEACVCDTDGEID